MDRAAPSDGALPSVVPVHAASPPLSNAASAASGGVGTMTEETMKATLAVDKARMKLIPILWEGFVRRKGDWLPRWEEAFATMDGRWLRFYESKTKYVEAQSLEEKTVRVRLPIGSPPHSARRSNSQRVATFHGTTPMSAPPAVPVKGESTKTKIAVGDKKHYLTVTAVSKEHAGRAHGFSVSVAERKQPLHLAVETEIERVVWIHLLQAALDQQRELDKPKNKTSALAEYSSLTMAAMWRLLPPGMIAKTLVGAPIAVNLVQFYDAWGWIQGRKGNFADLLPCLHPNVAISSNYPPSVPVAGEYRGRAGALCYFTDMHAGMDVTQYSIDNMARSGDLAVVTGWETIRNSLNGRKFRHLWKHELRFEADGRISHINIIADKVAAAVAFAVQTEGPSLELPHEQEESLATCPPGEIRVVCISGRQLRKKKLLPSSADVKVVIGLNGFPHLMLKAAMAHKSLIQNGSSRVYSTTMSKASTGPNPRWAETLSIQYSGAVPGTSTCLFLEVWQMSMIGDELIGCAKVNLAQHLVLSTGTEEEMASCAIPKWYDLRKPELFNSSSSPNKRSSVASSSTDVTEKDGSTCGRIQLSISFLPYTEELEVTEDAQGSVTHVARTPRHRKSFDRLLALHEETEAKQKVQLEKRSQSTSSLLVGSKKESADTLANRGSSSGKKSSRRSGKSSNSSSSEEASNVPTQTIVPQEMYTFTVASTKFRVYTRYQLIRAIGHGAYGVVIAASDQITGNSVAIKNIPKTFDDLVDAKRIVREIRLMRHLTHPNVLTVIDLMRPPSLKTFDDTYIVTDLMETDLHRVINSQEVLSSDHIAYIMYQMLCGLRYIHSARIIHRDIKPSNILINRDCFVKICDFGLARGIDVQEGEKTMEQALTEYVVTRWYRSPELLLASKYAPAIDVWSVGCILAEMFTRKPLFPGHDHVHQLNLILQLVGSPATPEDLGFITNPKAKRWMLKQAKHSPKSLSTVCPTAPPDALDLMSKLLEFDPRKRISVEDALAHPFLAAYRKEEMESTASGAFDFSFEIENGVKKNLDKETLRRLIFEDVCHFHPEAQEELDAYMLEQQRLQDVEAQERERQQQIETSPRSARAGIA